MQQPQKAPSPELIFDLINGYQRSAAIKAAIEVELFTAIAEGNTTPKSIAPRCRISERGARILADYLTVAGLITKKDGMYGLTADTAAFLDRRSQSYIGGATQFLLSPELMKGFTDFTAAVRKGGSIIPDDATLAPENPLWVDFARGMAPLMVPAAQAIPEIAGAPAGNKWKVLDVAAGHGLFGIMLAVENPNAEIIALDWPNVLEVAHENAAKFGVANRWKKLSGDALTIEYGIGYDIVLLTNFLHHFDTPTCEKILRKVRTALKSDGRVITLEFVPNEDRVSPPLAAAFPLFMLAGTPSGDAYTFSEFQQMFKNAGFIKSEIHDLPGLPQRLIISYA